MLAVVTDYEVGGTPAMNEGHFEAEVIFGAEHSNIELPRLSLVVGGNVEFLVHDSNGAGLMLAVSKSLRSATRIP